MFQGVVELGSSVEATEDSKEAEDEPKLCSLHGRSNVKLITSFTDLRTRITSCNCLPPQYTHIVLLALTVETLIMLKRRRESSPLPTVHEDEASVSAMKRQRVIAPILNGEYRGWADPSPDDDEWYDEEDEVAAPSAPQCRRQYSVQGSSRSNAPPREADITIYAAANNMLHNLHNAHQQRASLLQTHSSHSLSSVPINQDSSSHSLACSPMPTTRSTPAYAITNDLLSEEHINSTHADHPGQEETLVRLQYENHNKCVYPTCPLPTMNLTM
jgi:hypothetical protein